ncbi:MAG: response regulator transcription factor [Prolixibacteraceae bacterium]|jgi:DNA-binding response OmpR family regulator|nr:response regulator transcription factor [Prolixibacteraceae bacterium]
MKETYRILVVEDEEDINEILKFNLENEGYAVDSCFSAEEALKKNLSRYDLILLDVMMGKMSGYNLAQKIRKELQLNVSIIFLTARTTENDLLTGFNIGADDYITKPFSIKEVEARVKAVLKRGNKSSSNEAVTTLQLGDLILDLESKRLYIGKQKIDLSRKEFDILYLLGKSPGKVYSREEILNRIWESDVIVTDRTVDVNMTRLRKKMEDAGAYIRNKPGFGYYFEI